MYTYVYTYVYTHTYTHTYTYTHMHTFMYVCMYAYRHLIKISNGRGLNVSCMYVHTYMPETCIHGTHSPWSEKGQNGCEHHLPNPFQRNLPCNACMYTFKSVHMQIQFVCTCMPHSGVYEWVRPDRLHSWYMYVCIHIRTYIHTYILKYMYALMSMHPCMMAGIQRANLSLAWGFILSAFVWQSVIKFACAASTMHSLSLVVRYSADAWCHEKMRLWAWVELTSRHVEREKASSHCIRMAVQGLSAVVRWMASS
jgi:hypothetical protein